MDYAALGETGVNFFTGLGTMYASVPYQELREQCLELAGKLLGLGVEKGDRVALVAETDPEFVRFFFACQYAGLVPVALPTSIKLGAHSVYVEQLHRLLEASNAALAFMHCRPAPRPCQPSTLTISPTSSTPPVVPVSPAVS
jgi:fatty-acyl-CoA synthase